MKKSLNHLFLATAVLPLVIVSLAFTEYLGSRLREDGERRVEEFKETLLARKKHELQSYTDIACCAVKKYFDESATSRVGDVLQQRGNEFRDTLLRYYDTYKDTLPKETIQQFIISFVKAHRLEDGVGYFWINDFHPNMICHPVVPKLDGTDLSDFADSQGVFLFKEAVELCKRQGYGFIDYKWMNPLSGKEEKKRSYVVVFKPFNWIIGTGEHVSVLRTRLQKKALETISRLRYDKDNYFWINDFDCSMILHPVKPELEGRNLSTFSSVDGTFLFREFVKAGRSNGEGTVIYKWPRPGSREPVPKMSYVRAFDPWRWIIGTGTYIHDINSMVARERLRIKDEVSALVWSLRIFAFPVVLVVAFLSLILVTKYVIRPLSEIVTFLSGFDNDLTTPLSSDYMFEFESLADSFNILLQSLSELVSRIVGASSSVDDTVTNISTQVERQSAQLNQQFAAINEITATVEELSASSEQIASNAGRVQIIADKSTKRSKEGMEAIKIVSENMKAIHLDNREHKHEIDELREKTNQISQVMELINDIAEQTKLIAFNAALEASSAGVEGRRFKVVASEIRNLTDRVMEATNSIDAAIRDIQGLASKMVQSAQRSSEGVENGQQVTVETCRLLEDIVKSTKETSTSVKQIVLSTQQQRSASAQIVVAMREIKDGAGETSSAVKMVSQDAAKLEELSKELKELVSHFKV